MKSFKLVGFVVLASAGLFILGACNNQASDGSNTNSSTTETTGKTETVASSNKNTDHSQSSKGGQVVETGKYHFFSYRIRLPQCY